MNNVRLYDKSLSFSASLLFSCYSDRVDTSCLGMSECFNLGYARVFNVEGVSSKLVLFNSRKGLSSMFRVAARSLLGKIRMMAVRFSIGWDVLERSLVALHAGTMQEVISVFNGVTLSHKISYLNVFTGSKAVTCQCREVISRIRRLFASCFSYMVDKYHISSIFSDVNYFDRGIGCLLFQGYNY
ncbi:MAG: hypothetical protein ACTJLM_02475 [Ehrlichia sp.]